MCSIAFIGSLGPMEMALVGMIALLLFGKRLPEVARSLGKGLTEFKKGLQGIEDQVDTNAYKKYESSNSNRPTPPEDRVEATAPKFEPPKSEPTGVAD